MHQLLDAGVLLRSGSIRQASVRSDARFCKHSFQKRASRKFRCNYTARLPKGLQRRTTGSETCLLKDSWAFGDPQRFFKFIRPCSHEMTLQQ